MQVYCRYLEICISLKRELTNRLLTQINHLLDGLRRISMKQVVCAPLIAYASCFLN